MPRRKYEEMSLLEIMGKVAQAGLSDKKIEQENNDIWDSDDSLDIRIEKLLGLLRNPNRKNTNMLCFIMYDIESNKVRTQVFKYLQRKGCLNIQRSIFLADLVPQEFEAVKSDLTQIQSFYENHDSILIVPISTDYLKAMKIIGKSLNMDIILKNKNTLFF